MTNTGHKASSHLICTQSAFTMSAVISGARVPGQLWESLSANVESHRTLSVRFFTTLSQQILTALNTLLMTILFSAGQHTITSCMQRSQTAGTRILNFTSFNYGLQLNNPAVKQTDYKFWDSHISLIIGCESVRLKKSSSDWLNLVK